VISVDTKKKELVGNFRSGGREWQPTGTVDPVRVHDFPGDAVAQRASHGSHFDSSTRSWATADSHAFASTNNVRRSLRREGSEAQLPMSR
jgi:hypothetical protein